MLRIGTWNEAAGMPGMHRSFVLFKPTDIYKGLGREIISKLPSCCIQSEIYPPQHLFHIHEGKHTYPQDLEKLTQCVVTSYHETTMQFTNILSILCVLSTALALPTTTHQQDITVISAAMRRVNASLKKLDNALKASSNLSPNGNQQVLDLLALDWEVADEVRFSVQQISQGPKIPDLEAVVLLVDFYELPSLIYNVCDGWMVAKRLVQQAGRQKDVLEELINDSKAITQFSNALLGKLGKIPRAAGDGLTKILTTIMDVAIEDYRRP
jgi:hypothetical protein